MYPINWREVIICIFTIIAIFFQSSASNLDLEKENGKKFISTSHSTENGKFLKFF